MFSSLEIQPLIYISSLRYHNSRMISHDTTRGLKVEIKSNYSLLRLPQVSAPLDSGNYTCAPHNLRSDLVAVHILGGSGSLREVVAAEETAAAAVQDDDKSSQVGDFHSGAEKKKNHLQMLCICILLLLLRPLIVK